MSELFEGLFEAIGSLAGEAAGQVVEMAADGAGTVADGTVAAAGVVASGAGPVLTGVARVSGTVVGAAAEGVAIAATEGLVEGAIDVMGGAVPGSAPKPGSEPKPHPDPMVDRAATAPNVRPSQGQTRAAGQHSPND